MGALDLLKAADQAYWQDELMPTYPGFVLVKHVIWRGAIVGSLAATGVATAHVLYDVAVTKSSRNVTKPELVKRYFRYSSIGLAVGVALGFSMVITSAARKESMDPEGIADRGYRLANNTRQNTVDRFTYGGGALGLVVGISGPSEFGSLFWRAIGGTAIGSVIGLFAFAMIHKK